MSYEVVLRFLKHPLYLRYI